MPLTLHAATVPSWLQILNAGKGWLDKAEASDLPEAEIINARLIDDMLPFAYQVKSMAFHSAGAIEGVRNGVFSPDLSDPPSTIAGLRDRLDAAIGTLEAVTVDELEAMIGNDMRFEVPGRDFRVDFTAENFLLTFSEPNFYFHSTTAYGILRMKGLDIGKRDFLGPMRIKQG